MKPLFVGLLAAFSLDLAGQAAQAAPKTPLPPQASIPFVNHDGIRDWQATDSRTLYVQDSSRKWYRATMFAPCIDLPFAQTIGFETRGIDTFDRFSSIRVRGERCQISSLERSDAPPAKVKRAKS
ncbi:MAG: hypothetical protein KKE02_13445 [Alphaproteobacteria bacterium]|nr:hypothetical protein [Alphaproteobacteria bacterium]MBU1516956.1 hypothetical protein [Alphaproteobacteria bacterium]MBU2095844.1 hypothetical protein [Alphaproteobacteria bacterium]MBU2152019.1 hypothetical protein [Alphaproteobacteria bacterium]MBU2309540.1 hypothetical protein [Alphaproteobacteria bacterium]